MTDKDLEALVEKVQGQVLTRSLEELEHFRGLILKQDHDPGPLMVGNTIEGQVHTYNCATCGLSARFIAGFDAETMRFTFEKSGEALTKSCCKFRNGVLDMAQQLYRADAQAKRAMGFAPDLGRLVTTGRLEWRLKVYTRPVTNTGQGQENETR